MPHRPATEAALDTPQAAVAPFSSATVLSPIEHDIGDKDADRMARLKCSFDTRSQKNPSEVESARREAKVRAKAELALTEGERIDQCRGEGHHVLQSNSSDLDRTSKWEHHHHLGGYISPERMRGGAPAT